MKPLSHRALGLSPSMTVALDSRAKELKASGEDIVNLCAGELDKATPTFILNAAVECLSAGKVKYQSPSGIPELREEIAQHQNKILGLEYSRDQVVVSSGAKQAIFNALCAILNPGDEVLVPTPHWVTFPEVIKLLGGIPVFLPSNFESQYKVNIDALESKLTPKTKLLILNSPCNPTGTVYSQSELQAFASWLESKDLYCLSDEIYGKILYSGQAHQSIASQGIADRTIVINGMSKTYAMTGWRLGYSLSNPELADRMGAIQGQSTHHPSIPSQFVGLAALQKGESFVRDTVAELEENRRIGFTKLSSLPHVKTFLPSGAFYFFIDCQQLFQLKTCKNWDSEKLCRYFLEEHQVAVVPGSAFGMENHFRLSFGGDSATWKQGLSRIEGALANLA